MSRPRWKALSGSQLRELESLLPPGGVSVNASELRAHARDESAHDERPPDAIVYPRSGDDVSRILKFCDGQGVPVTPWGAGTSLEANPMALHGGLCLDVSHMREILEIRPEDLQATVQPGVVLQDLNERLSKHGLFFPPDPGAPCTIGGMVANNAAGIRAIKYGPTKEYVLRMEIVLANGEIIRCGTRAMRTSSGYDLLHLFIGSEGTLGVFTEITLKLEGIPPAVSAATAAFASLEQAAQTVVEMVQAGLAPAALELMDSVTMRDINAFKGMSLPETPTLFVEFSGNESAVAEDAELAREICESDGCTAYQMAVGREERDRLWEARHHTYYAAAAANPGKKAIITDVAVPMSSFPEIVQYAREQLNEHGLGGPIHGHAGDGNFHVGIFHEATAEEKAKAYAVNEALVLRAIELGGTATGEHGVGSGKIGFMESEHGESYRLMRRIKGLLDPNGILNPGKIFDRPAER